MSTGSKKVNLEAYYTGAGFDMIGYRRALGHTIYANHCPSCGRWAKTVAGDQAADSYWAHTNCAQCGTWSVTGWPWTNVHKLD